MKLSSPNSKGRAALDENVSDACIYSPSAPLKEEDALKIQIELRDTKEKLRTISQKYTTMRKERDNLKKETKDLQNEVMNLQNNMREMVPGFSNTGSIFPMYNELQTILSDFMKCSCEDIFFDYLSPELSMDGVVFFFKESLYSVHKIISNYFDPVIATLCKAMCIDKMGGPFNNVLRKSFQNNWKRIYSACITEEKCADIACRLQSKLHLRNDNQCANQAITDFLLKLSEVYLISYISEPEIILSLDCIGTKTQFNAIKHESLDGFIKNKDQCIVILPPAYKHTAGGEVIVKAHVLSANYEFA